MGEINEEQLSIARKNGGSKINVKAIILSIIVLTVAIIEVMILYFGANYLAGLIDQLRETEKNYRIIENANQTNTLLVDGVRITYDSDDWEIEQLGTYHRTCFRSLQYRI